MTAMDELRRLLDERGIEYYPKAADKTVFSTGTEHVHVQDDLIGGCLELFIRPVTPAQAVEATLGSDLQAENAKLRELVRHMHTCLEHYEPGDTISCEQCPYDNETWGCDYEHLMAELGVDA